MHRIIYMLSRTTLFAVCVAASLTACSYFVQPTHNVSVRTVAYDPAVSARIRILSANGGHTAKFRPAQDCYKGGFETDDQILTVGDGFWSTLKYSSNSETIGMVPSPRNWMRVDGLEFKDLISEHVVPAETPLTVLMSVNTSAGKSYSSCSPPAIMFNPAAGQDYDIFMDGASRRCWIAVRHIDGQGMDQPIAVKVAPRCLETVPAEQGD
jgi:hypothetical protein